MCTLENGNDKIDAFSEDYANNRGTYLSNFVTKISVFDDSGMRLPLSSSYKPETFRDENK